MTRRLRLVPALALLALVALPPAAALAVGTPVLTTPASSPFITKLAPALGWADLPDETSYDVLRKPTTGTPPNACADATGPTVVVFNGLAAGTTSWTDPLPLADGAYCYWVRGDDAGPVGTLSNQRVILYDTTAPSGTVTAPGASASVRGASVAVTSADVSDLGSGVSTVTFQRAVAGTGTWVLIDLDSSSTDGWGAAWDTTTGATPDGLYDLRAVFADAATNVTNTVTVANVRVDNTAPTTTQTAPAASVQVTGASVALSALADDGAGSGVAAVRFESSPAGTGTWSTIGTDAVSADGWSFTWNSLLDVDGLYDLRTVAVDGAGNEAPSAPVASVRVDNTPPSAPGAPTAVPAATNDAVTLVWPVSPSGDVIGYRIYRDGSGTPLNSALVTGSMFTDTALALNGSADGVHTYSLRAEDLTQLSVASSPVSVTLDTVAPQEPTVTATPQASGAIGLSWSAPADREASNDVKGTIDGVVVRRSAAGGTAPTTASDGVSVCTPGSAHSCSDFDTIRGATYAYAVFVRDAAGNSSRGIASAKASTAPSTPDPTKPDPKKPDPKKPAPPTAVRTTVDRQGRTVLAWKLPAGKDLARIVVVRGTAKHKPKSPGDGKTLYSGKGTRIALTLAPGSTTWLAVFAVNSAGKVSPAAAKQIAIGRISPGEGAELDGAVKLRWVRDQKADYYNVQIFRKGKRVLIDWPRSTKLGLVKGKLARGDYTAYVWPGYGELSAARYGKLIGSASFSYRG